MSEVICVIAARARRGGSGGSETRCEWRHWSWKWVDTSHWGI